MPDKTRTLYALTLKRPWPFAIFGLPPATAKRIENRTWKPPTFLIGQRLAIHAGKGVEHEAFEIPALARSTATALTDPHGALAEGIVGTVRVRGWIDVSPNVQEGQLWGGELTEAEAVAALKHGWFGGPIGWVFEAPLALERPIPCRGQQGVWPVPAAVFDQILEQGQLL